MLKADFFSLPANEMLSNTNSTQENTLNKGPSNFSRTSYILPEPELTMNKAFAQKWNTIIGNLKKIQINLVQDILAILITMKIFKTMLNE